ncbi:uncharacterized protein LOC113862591 [Abrus precatorius]|uniref:Uncharacterized protein LOC113862591 n=1 Tax=Abrus precatorius TaxID=3816 RepID=A0A8B8L9Q3_ABRPR|nr:uncharacterized protein LOC113862591 [Abrus precatorius]
MECPNHAQSLQYNSPGAPYRCSGCRELGFGASYRCKNCSYILHDVCKNCVSFATHPFFPRSDFEFYETAPGNRTRYCDACGKDVLGFVFHCTRTGKDLHPCCLNLKASISDEEGLVKLELCEEVPSKCAKCKHRNVVDGVKGWSYVSSEGTCYHVSCVKEMVLENWKKGYFSQSQETNSNGMSETEHSQLALRSKEIVQSERSSRRSSTIKKYTKIAVLVFQLIFSAIFGNPVIAIATLVEALVKD